MIPDTRNEATKAKHHARALRAIATHLCATDMTDGFCQPRDGKCIGQGGERPGHRNCIVRAEGCLFSLKTCGMTAVWLFDKSAQQQQPKEDDHDQNSVAA